MDYDSTLDAHAVGQLVLGSTELVPRILHCNRKGSSLHPGL